MQRIPRTFAKLTLGAALSLSAATAQAAPVSALLPELVLPLPSHHSHRSAEMDRKKSGQVRDLGDYNLPGERSGESSTARLDANGAILL